MSWDKNRYAPGWHADVACYSMEGTKLFALQSHTMAGFDSSDPRRNGVRFDIINPGLVDRDIRVDLGVRPNAYQPYDVVIENALFLSPSNKLIQENRLPDVLLVPQATCTALST